MKKFFEHIVTLRENTDFEKTKTTISEGVSIKGYNLWILVCSTILASIGLDTNSTAVIIGAMLISPLMSPILGVGLSLGIHDRQLLFRSLRDLSLAVLISLAASVIYFILSPLGQPTLELKARTFPTLLDVLVALFGGIAGIVSISRHNQTNAIPGVAIATALMPPLCTAGFGIATLNLDYFLGAFYLFFINAVFISLATYLIVRYLHFPEKEFSTTKIALRYRTWFIVISMIALTPSIYFLYTVYKNELIKKDIDQLVITTIKNHGDEILKWEVVNNDTAVVIKAYYSGRLIDDSLRKAIDSTLIAHKLRNYHLLATRVNLTKEEISKLSEEMTRQVIDEMHLQEIRKEIASEKAKDTLSFTQIFAETKIAFPYIDTLFNGWMMCADSVQDVDTIPIVFYRTPKPINKTQTNQLYNFLTTRLSADTVVLVKNNFVR